LQYVAVIVFSTLNVGEKMNYNVYDYLHIYTILRKLFSS
jgi:hypothetical protein